MSMNFPPDTDEDGLRDLVTTFHGLHDWIEGLVEKNKLLEQENAELKNAKDAARLLRRENDRLKKAQRDSSTSDGASNATHADDEKNNYILVLVDGNAIPFNDTLLSRGEPGGKIAAESLLQQAFQAARKKLKNVRFSTMMTIYASVDHIASNLIENHTITSTEDFRAFSRAFTAAKPLGNMIDVGDTIEAADNKVRAELKQWHLDNPACRLIFLGLSTDANYARTLEFLKTTDSPHLHKVILLTGPPLPSDVAELPFRHEHMKVFGTQKLGPTYTYHNSPVAAVRPNRAKSSSNSSTNRWSLTSPNGTNCDGGSKNHHPWTSKTAAKRKSGKNRPSDEAFNYVKGLKPGPCNEHYLFGECARGGCLYRHDYILSQDQIAAIRSLVMDRNGDCRYGRKCNLGEKCVRYHPESDDESDAIKDEGCQIDDKLEQEEDDVIPSWMRPRKDSSESSHLLDTQHDNVNEKKWRYDREQLLGIGKMVEQEDKLRKELKKLENKEDEKDAGSSIEDDYQYGHPPVDLAFLLD